MAKNLRNDQQGNARPHMLTGAKPVEAPRAIPKPKPRLQKGASATNP